MADDKQREDHSLVAGASRRHEMRSEEGAQLSRAVLQCASRDLTRVAFLREVSNVLLDFCSCDAIEVRLNEGDLHYRWETTRRPQVSAGLELVKWTVRENGRVIPAFPNGTDLERLCADVASDRVDTALPFFTGNGSFWTGDTWEPLTLSEGGDQRGETQSLRVGGHYRSLAVTRFFVDENTIGLLHIKNEQRHCFASDEIEFCEEVAQALGLAVAGWQAQAALRERIKELTCLYGIARIVEEPEFSLQDILTRVVRLLPPAWQHPANAVARIVLDDRSYTSPRFRTGRYRQSADIIVHGRERGIVEVVYLEEGPELTAGAFLTEEEQLIRAIARELALIVERKEAEEEKSKLQQQLAHADRLATIGQLAAGVAHELNEPLGSILGFAQLGKGCPGLPEQAENDLEKIITASLYAREVIRKLMVFSRQVPSQSARISLNEVIEEGLYFLEARCAKEAVELVRELAPDLPEITADAAQIKQVLVNLVVNATQAMPNGGTLTISTRVSNSFVFLSVEDTGTGMSKEIIDQAFLPFFTTKDVGEGTGLGLAVVHGIVAAHGGSIDVKSESGQGTRFEIRLPVHGSDEIQEVSEDGARS
jgi:signal transduction histidine kinase